MKPSGSGRFASVIAYSFVAIAALGWSIAWLNAANPFGQLSSINNLWFALLAIPGIWLLVFGVRGLIKGRQFRDERKWLRILSLTFAIFVLLFTLLLIALLETGFNYG